MPKANNQPRPRFWPFAIFIIISLFFVSAIISGIISLSEDELMLSGGNVAVIHIDGTITTFSSSGIFEDPSVSSTEIVSQLEELSKNKNIKAVIFEINSGGGSPVASEEISKAIEDLDIPTVAWIRDIGASGAYWIAASCDYIIANRMSLTGSVGVTSAGLGFEGLLKHYNISYRKLTSGEYKDMGTPLREMTPEEKQKFMDTLAVIHGYFVEHVESRRNITGIPELWSGEIILGSRAYKLGLIDKLGGKSDAVEYIKNRINESVELVDVKEERSFIDALTGVLSRSSFSLGRGIGTSIIEQENRHKVWI